MEFTEKEAWDKYKGEELDKALPILGSLGYTLNDKQVHIEGERYLMAGAQDVGESGKKLVLTGIRNSDRKKVAIKCSSNPAGIKEIEAERKSRKIIENIKFAYKTLLAPKEILFAKREGLLVFVTEYIAEDIPFLKLPPEKQFFLALKGLKMQEGIHVTAHSHTKHIEKVFIPVYADDYMQSAENFVADIKKISSNDTDLVSTLDKTLRFFHDNKETTERYCDFLTHADFVLHNLRVKNDDIYLLDFASIHFGNKYESWGRFLNYMTLYNPKLSEWLSLYVKENRGDEEYLALRLMRTYKLVFLLRYYVTSLPKTSGDLHSLTQARIDFWTDILAHILEDTEVPDENIEAFKDKRELLRSEAEKQRQKELGQLF